MKEHVVLVDEQDNPLRTEEKMRAHELGLLHRAFSVFIYRKYNGTVEFLLQQRHSDKYHCGGLWTNTCCSHPRWNEDILSAAQRRLKEEMSLDIPLKKIGSFIYHANFSNGLIEHELDHVFIGEFQKDMKISIDPNEVQNYAWVSLSSLQTEQRAEGATQSQLENITHVHSISSCDKAPLKVSSGAYELVCEQRAEAATQSQLERRRTYTPWFRPALIIALEGLCLKF